MPVIHGAVVNGVPSLTWTYPAWHWAPIRGNPAQAYGEPYPSLGWILERAYSLLGYRWTQQYAQADAIRQWLWEYGMQVNYGPDSIEIKY